MEKFIPYEKLSKKKKRELDRKRRRTWGSLSPVTRKPPDPKAYDRRKARKRYQEEYPSVPSLFYPPEVSGERKGRDRTGGSPGPYSMGVPTSIRFPSGS